MIWSALLSSLHVLALAIGLPGVFLRGRALARLPNEPAALGPLFAADNAWGLAALLWISTGLTRALGPFEKGPGFYGHSTLFWVKMSGLGAVLLLELLPMVTFIRWRIAQAKGQPIDFSSVPRLRGLNRAELLLTLALPFLASMMARGLGF